MSNTDTALGTLQDLATASYDLIRHPFGGEAPPAPTPPAPPAGTIPPVAPRTQEDVKTKYGLPATADITKPYFDPANKDVKDADAFSRASQEFNPPPAKPSFARRALDLTGVTDIHGAEGGLAPRTVEETVSPLEWIAGETAMEAAAPYLNKVVGPVVSDVADRVSAWRQARDAAAGFEGRTINLQPSEYNFSDIGGTEVAPAQKALPAAPTVQPEAAVQPAVAKPAPIDFSEVGGTQIKPGGGFSGALNEGSKAANTPEWVAGEYSHEINRLENVLRNPDATAEDKAIAGHMLQSTREQAEAGLSQVVQKSAVPEPIGVHEDDLPYRAKYQDVDFSAQDLQDSGKKVTAETIRKDYAGGDKNASIYQSYIPIEDLPSPKWVDPKESDFDRSDYGRPRSPVPIKVEVTKDGTFSILDGNHRAQVWDESGHQYAPAWVVDRRHPNIEMLSENEKAELADTEDEAGLSPVVQKTATPENVHTQRGAQSLTDHLKSKMPDADISVVGSVAQKGESAHDLDLKISGTHDPQQLESALSEAGFRSTGSSVVTPKEVEASDKDFGGSGWKRAYHFESAAEPQQKIDVWVDLPNDTPEVVDAKIHDLAKQAGLQYKGSMEGRGGEVYHTFDDPAKPGDQINVKQSELPAENVGQFLQDKMAAKRSQAGSTGETVEQMRQRILAEHGLGPTVQKSVAAIPDGYSGQELVDKAKENGVSAWKISKNNPEGSAGWLSPEGTHFLAINKKYISHNAVANQSLFGDFEADIDGPERMFDAGWVRKGEAGYEVNEISPKNLDVIEKSLINSHRFGQELYIDQSRGTPAEMEIPAGWENLSEAVNQARKDAARGLPSDVQKSAPATQPLQPREIGQKGIVGNVRGDIHHEMGHVLVANHYGIGSIDGIWTGRHPAALPNSAAGMQFDFSSWGIKPGESVPLDTVRDHLNEILDMFMGGGAGEESTGGLPMSKNGGMNNDIFTMRHVLTKLGYGPKGTDVKIASAQRRAKQILMESGAPDIMKKYSAAREEGLPDTHHMSQERVEELVQEVQNAKQKAGQGGTDLGTTGTATAEDRGADVARREGGGAQGQPSAEAVDLRSRPSKEIYLESDKGNVYGNTTSSRYFGSWMEDSFVKNPKLAKKIGSQHSRVAFLNGIEVSPDVRGQGAGNDLLNRFTNEARKDGATAIVLVADTGGKQAEGFDLASWYRRNGFKKIGDAAAGPVLMKDLRGTSELGIAQKSAEPEEGGRIFDYRDQKYGFDTEEQKDLTERMFPNLGGAIPEAKGKLPDTGTWAAVRTLDNQLFVDRNWQGSTHITFIKERGIPPDKVKDGGWLVDGDYEPTQRSEASQYGERARAILQTQKNRAAEEGDTSFAFGANAPKRKRPNLSGLAKRGDSAK